MHRVRAFAFAARQEFFLAKNEYEAAIALAGERAPLRLRFGGLLSRMFDDQEAALEQILKAEEGFLSARSHGCEIRIGSPFPNTSSF